MLVGYNISSVGSAIGKASKVSDLSLFRQREAAAASRKDSKLKAVVISEAWDKKSSKYNSPSVPFPFDSKTTYEHSMRTPMGQEYNTTATHRSGLSKNLARSHSRLKYHAA